MRFKLRGWHRIILLSISLALIMELCLYLLIKSNDNQIAAEMQQELTVNEELLDINKVPTFVTQEQIEEYGHVERLYCLETELNTVAFRNNDGSETIYYLNYPLRYVDSNGELKDIDLTVKEDQTTYSVTTSPVQLLFSKDVTDGIRLSYDDYRIQFVPIREDNNTDLGNIETALMSSVHVADNIITYRNYFADEIDVRYTPLYNGVKEDIVLTKYSGINEFEFLISTGGMQIYKTSEGDFYIAESETSKMRIEIGNVVAYDAENDIKEGNATIVPIKEGFYYKLTISIDTDFLTDTNTLYPVVIDPTVTISDEINGIDSIQDSPIFEGLPDTNCGSYSYNSIGYVDGTYKTGRTAVRLYGMIQDSVYATLSSTAVKNAKFYVKDSSGASAKTVNIYSLTNNTWTESGVTWNNLGTINPTLHSSSTIGNLGWTAFDITSLVRGWKDNVYNSSCGFVMKAADESQKCNFYSSEHSSVDCRPYLAITYQYAETVGIESGQTYYIKNNYSGHYLQGATDLNFGVYQNIFHGDSYQQWKVVYQGNGLYKLYNQYAPYISDRCCLDLASKSTGVFDLFWDGEDDAITFYIIKNGNGTYRLLNVWPNGAEVMTARDQYALSDVYNSTWKNRTTQQWIFELANTKLSDVKTFSAFDIGDSSEDEIALFKRYLEYNGYTNVGVYDNKNYLVPAQAIKDIGRYSDIIYLNGHGGDFANLIVYDSNKITTEYLCADSSVDPGDDVPRVGIGAQWLTGTSIKTNSYWNKKTKWAILAQCSQFNYGTEQEGNHWNGLNSAQVWARTMLGDGNRMHGYLGYYLKAPGGSVHLERLERFLIHSSKDNNMPIVDAWKYANQSLVGNTNWAALYHSANISDTFSQFTEDTVNGSAYTIYLVRREPGTIQLSVNESTANLSSVEDDTSYPIMYENIEKEKMDMIKNTLKAQLDINSKTKLQLHDNGRIEYMNWNYNWGEEAFEFEISEKEAIDLAKEKLEELDLLPQDNYRISVSKVNRYQINLDDDRISSPETIEYTVCFYRTYNGLDVLSDQEDGIIISINKNGISGLDYLWREMKATSNNPPSAKELSIEQVRDIYNAEITDAYEVETGNDLQEANTNLIIRMAYLQTEDAVRKIWVCSEDNAYLNSVYIDLYTGEVIYGK